MKISLAGGAGVGEGAGFWERAATHAPRIIKVLKATCLTQYLMVRILGLSYSTPRKRYQGAGVETTTRVALQARRTLCDYWFNECHHSQSP
jgi:hypothetical protein